MISVPLDRAKVVVTGASGFLGKHLVRALLKKNCRPILVEHLRRPIPGVPEGQVIRIRLDLTNYREVGDFLDHEQPDLLFHLAGTRGSDSAQEIEACTQLNEVVTCRLLDAACRAKVGRILLVGSAEEYGSQPPPQHEDLPLLPTSTYGITKAAATRFALKLHASINCPVVILRPFTIYGPGQPTGMFVSQAITCAVEGLPFQMTEGNQRRDLVEVNDVVRAFLYAATVVGIEGKVINVGSGIGCRLRDVATLIWDLARAKGTLQVGKRVATPSELRDTCADIAFAKKLLGWQPVVNLEKGLRRTIMWKRITSCNSSPAK